MGTGNVTTHFANQSLGSQAPPLLGMGKGQKGGRGYPQEYGMHGYGYRDLSHMLTQTMSDVLPISAWDGTWMYGMIGTPDGEPIHQWCSSMRQKRL